VVLPEAGGPVTTVIMLPAMWLVAALLDAASRYCVNSILLDHQRCSSSLSSSWSWWSLRPTAGRRPGRVVFAELERDFIRPVGQHPRCGASYQVELTISRRVTYAISGSLLKCILTKFSAWIRGISLTRHFSDGFTCRPAKPAGCRYTASCWLDPPANSAMHWRDSHCYVMEAS
jgi:hypothetical protein